MSYRFQIFVLFYNVFSIYSLTYYSKPFHTFRLECPKSYGLIEVSMRMMANTSSSTRHDVLFRIICDDLHKMFPANGNKTELNDDTIEREECRWTYMFNPLMDHNLEVTCSGREYLAGMARIVKDKNDKFKVMFCKLKVRDFEAIIHDEAETRTKAVTTIPTATTRTTKITQRLVTTLNRRKPSRRTVIHREKLRDVQESISAISKEVERFRHDTFDGFAQDTFTTTPELGVIESFSDPQDEQVTDNIFESTTLQPFNEEETDFTDSDHVQPDENSPLNEFELNEESITIKPSLIAETDHLKSSFVHSGNGTQNIKPVTINPSESAIFNSFDSSLTQMDTTTATPKFVANDQLNIQETTTQTTKVVTPDTTTTNFANSKQVTAVTSADFLPRVISGQPIIVVLNFPPGTEIRQRNSEKTSSVFLSESLNGPQPQPSVNRIIPLSPVKWPTPPPKAWDKVDVTPVSDDKTSNLNIVTHPTLASPTPEKVADQESKIVFSDSKGPPGQVPTNDILQNDGVSAESRVDLGEANKPLEHAINAALPPVFEEDKIGSDRSNPKFSMFSKSTGPANHTEDVFNAEIPTRIQEDKLDGGSPSLGVVPGFGETTQLLMPATQPTPSSRAEEEQFELETTATEIVTFDRILDLEQIFTDSIPFQEKENGFHGNTQIFPIDYIEETIFPEFVTMSTREQGELGEKDVSPDSSVLIPESIEERPAEPPKQERTPLSINQGNSKERDISVPDSTILNPDSVDQITLEPVSDTTLTRIKAETGRQGSGSELRKRKIDSHPERNPETVVEREPERVTNGEAKASKSNSIRIIIPRKPESGVTPSSGLQKEFQINDNPNPESLIFEDHIKSITEPATPSIPQESVDVSEASIVTSPTSATEANIIELQPTGQWQTQSGTPDFRTLAPSQNNTAVPRSIAELILLSTKEKLNGTSHIPKLVVGKDSTSQRRRQEVIRETISTGSKQLLPLRLSTTQQPTTKPVFSICTRHLAVVDDSGSVVACGIGSHIWTPNRCPTGTNCVRSLDSIYSFCCSSRQTRLSSRLNK